ALKRNAILRGCKSIAWSLNRRRASFEASLREHLRMTSFPELSEVCRHSEERCGIAAARLEPRTKPMQSKLSRPDESAKRGISQDAPRRFKAARMHSPQHFAGVRDYSRPGRAHVKQIACRAAEIPGADGFFERHDPLPRRRDARPLCLLRQRAHLARGAGPGALAR